VAVLAVLAVQPVREVLADLMGASVRRSVHRSVDLIDLVDRSVDRWIVYGRPSVLRSVDRSIVYGRPSVLRSVLPSAAKYPRMADWDTTSTPLLPLSCLTPM